MCLNLIAGLTSQRAIGNIPVYKYLKSGSKSQHQNFVYRRFKVNEKKLLVPDYNYSEGIHLNEGYHSRKEESLHPKTHLFVIPKWSEFFEGGENSQYHVNGYCSNTIIYIGKNNWFNRLIGKIFYKVKFKSEKELKKSKEHYEL